MGITYTKSVAMLAAGVHMLGICAYERPCLFIVTIVDFWTYATPEVKKNKIQHLDKF